MIKQIYQSPKHKYILKRTDAYHLQPPSCYPPSISGHNMLSSPERYKAFSLLNNIFLQIRLEFFLSSHSVRPSVISIN